MVLDDRAHNPLIMRYEPSAVMDDLQLAALQEPSAPSRSYSAIWDVIGGLLLRAGRLGHEIAHDRRPGGFGISSRALAVGRCEQRREEARVDGVDVHDLGAAPGSGNQA